MLKPLKTEKHCMSSSRHDGMTNREKTLFQWMTVCKAGSSMAGESGADITALASLWHNTDNWTIRTGPSRADAQLITTSLIAHRSGRFPGACSKWSEASDIRQTLPNAVRGASQRACGNTRVRWRLHSCSKLETQNTHISIKETRHRDLLPKHISTIYDKTLQTMQMSTNIFIHKSILNRVKGKECFWLFGAVEDYT